jgi:non-ribosomal peptide synthetase component F
LIVERVGVHVDVVEDNAVRQPMSPTTAPGDVVHRNTGAPSALSLSPSTRPHTSPIIEESICLGLAMTNLNVFLSASADMRPGAAALLCGDVTTSFSVLSRGVARFADYLIDGGLRLGDRVAIMLSSRPELVVVLYGVLQAGAVLVR